MSDKQNKRGQVKLEPSWLAVVGDEFDKPYMTQLKAFLQVEKAAGKVIYPAAANWFNALNTTPFERVEVVILGQDPYHGPGQAHGLCFSVQPGVPAPPSLQNMFKELHDDLGIPISPHGYLQHWAEQGVLLLNSVLTVAQAQANSHQGKGWEVFTREREGLVFLLWGSYAQKKGQLIDRNRHLVLQAPHPSPLSSYRGFFGCKHFSKTNDYLQRQGKAPIDWTLPPLK
jgi:uracil-DNA glycosylase